MAYQRQVGDLLADIVPVHGWGVAEVSCDRELVFVDSLSLNCTSYRCYRWSLNPRVNARVQPSPVLKVRS